MMLTVFTVPAFAADNIKDIAIKFKDATSFYLLAQKYAIGGGTYNDYKEALKWYHEAAKLGHLKSEFQLGRFYFEGLGTKIDYDKAAKWLLEPANNGYNAAQYMLGMIYLNGSNDIKRDNKKAFEWLKQSADDYNINASLQVGKMYFYGTGVARNVNKAKQYLHFAEEQEIEEAKELLAKIEQDTQQFIPAVTPENDSPVSPIETLLNAAKTGNSDSQFKLATAYLNGTSGFERDESKAVIWLKKAAEKDHKKAQYLLGSMYYNGNWVKRDLDKARRLLGKAAAAGIEDAKLLMSAIKSQQKLNNAKAGNSSNRTGDLFLKSARSGDKEAQFKVGLLYLYGDDGFPQDNQKALHWFQQAADQNHTKAQFQTGMMYYKPGVDDSDVARTWLRKAAQNGHTDAQYFLGTIYNQKREFDNAIKWLELAFESDHRDAIELLVEIYITGQTGSIDDERALKWLEKASATGLRDAQYKLGELYLEKLTTVNHKKVGFAWIEKSARKGYTEAKFKLATLYKKGTGVRRQYTKSARWFREAAQQGHIEAQYQLAELYEQGLGLPRDKAKARTWYEKAADQGHVKARIKLGSGARF